jgi:hypothetical protein
MESEEAGHPASFFLHKAKVAPQSPVMPEIPRSKSN